MSNKHTLDLTRGALYILEGLLQDVGPCTTPAKITKWSRLYAKVRNANNRMITTTSSPKPYDIERPFIRSEAESDIAWATRKQEHADAFERWNDESVTFVLNDKQRDIAREAITWVTKNQNPAPGSQAKAAVRLQMTKHVGMLFAALGFGEDEDEDEKANENEEGEDEALKSASAAG